jgi:hypothetical protein
MTEPEGLDALLGDGPIAKLPARSLTPDDAAVAADIARRVRDAAARLPNWAARGNVTALVTLNKTDLDPAAGQLPTDRNTLKRPHPSTPIWRHPDDSGRPEGAALQAITERKDEDGVGPLQGVQVGPGEGVITIERAFGLLINLYQEQ